MSTILTSSSTWAGEPGTRQESVARRVAQGWVVVGDYHNQTVLEHPSLEGTRVSVQDDR